MNKEYLIKLIEENNTTKEIAVILNISQTTVMYWLKKYNLKTLKAKKRVYLKCKTCDKLIKGRGLEYCSSLCHKDSQYQKYIDDWKNNLVTGIKGNSTSSYIKKYMLIKTENKCQECGWNKLNIYTNKIPLELEHIDGDHSNNKESNLKILCPNCHSLTSTYKGANKNSSRKR